MEIWKYGNRRWRKEELLSIHLEGEVKALGRICCHVRPWAEAPSCLFVHWQADGRRLGDFVLLGNALRTGTMQARSVAIKSGKEPKKTTAVAPWSSGLKSKHDSKIEINISTQTSSPVTPAEPLPRGLCLTLFRWWIATFQTDQSRINDYVRFAVKCLTLLTVAV